MEACIYKKFGKASVLEWVGDWPTPTCDPDSVLIKVAASSINPKDALLRRGKFKKAKKLFGKVLEKSPGFGPARRQSSICDRELREIEIRRK